MQRSDRPAAFPETMGLEEAAGFLHLGRDATRALWEAGEIAGVSLNQKHVVFRKADLDEYLAAEARRQQAERRRRAAPAPEPGRRGRKRRARAALPESPGQV